MAPNPMAKFCGNDWKVWNGQLDITDCEEASGLAVSSHKKYLYINNDSPEDKPYIFCYEKANPRNRTVIDVTGIGYPHFNGGYGDWEALGVGVHPQTRKNCIIIADIGHNRARVNQGKLRTEDQQTRLIYVEEPTEREFKNAVGKTIQKPGVDFPFQYTDKNVKHDAEAMAICGDNVIIITKNTRDGDKRCFVYCAYNSVLVPNALNVFTVIGQVYTDFSEVTDAFATPEVLVLRTYVGINFYAMCDMVPGQDAPIRGCHKLQELRDRGQQEAIAYDDVEKMIFFIGEGSPEMFCIPWDASSTMAFGHAPVKLPRLSAPLPHRVSDKQLAGKQNPRKSHQPRQSAYSSSSKGRKSGKSVKRPSDEKEEAMMVNAKPQMLQRDVDIQWLHRASGLCVSSNSCYLYVVDDTPGPLPYIFVYDKKSGKRMIIEVKGIKDFAYLPRRGCGFGAWQSLTLGVHPKTKKKCIIIGDIGNNTGWANRRPLRRNDQPTRLIYVEEPSHVSFDGTNLPLQGTEYLFQYGDRDDKLDSEALCVVEDNVLLITRNTKTTRKVFVYSHSNSALQTNAMHTFQYIGECAIDVSEVTDAFCTSKLLGLRTYLGVSFYSLAELQPGISTAPRGALVCSDLKNCGVQEAMGYDDTNKELYFLGQGSTELYALPFDAGIASSTWGSFTGKPQEGKPMQLPAVGVGQEQPAWKTKGQRSRGRNVEKTKLREHVRKGYRKSSTLRSTNTAKPVMKMSPLPNKKHNEGVPPPVPGSHNAKPAPEPGTVLVRR